MWFYVRKPVLNVAKYILKQKGFSAKEQNVLHYLINFKLDITFFFLCPWSQDICSQ